MPECCDAWKVTHGLGRSVLRWFSSYVNVFHCGSSRSTSRPIKCGVLLESVFGPILFLLYTADLLRLIELHHLQLHLFANDTRVYGTGRPSAVADLQNRAAACIDDMALWMMANRLQRIADKTEVLWCASARRQHQIPLSGLRVSADVVLPSTSVPDVGIYLESDLSLWTHVT